MRTKITTRSNHTLSTMLQTCFGVHWYHGWRLFHVQNCGVKKFGRIANMIWDATWTWATKHLSLNNETPKLEQRTKPNKKKSPAMGCHLHAEMLPVNGGIASKRKCAKSNAMITRREKQCNCNQCVKNKHNQWPPHDVSKTSNNLKVPWFHDRYMNVERQAVYHNHVIVHELCERTWALHRQHHSWGTIMSIACNNLHVDLMNCCCLCNLQLVEHTFALILATHYINGWCCQTINHEET